MNVEGSKEYEEAGADYAVDLLAKNKEQKELIDKLCSQEPCPKCGYGVTGACYGCEIKRLQTELAKHRWIPVAERLPEKNGDYLVRWDTGILEKIHFTPKFSKIKFYMKTNVSEVTHWMPIILPEGS